MIRYALFVLSIAATAATALAAIHPVADGPAATSANVTVIHMNRDFPYYGPVAVDQCAVEDCSDE